jgi:signal transduction histidine kinase
MSIDDSQTAAMQANAEHAAFSDERIAAAFDCLRIALTVFDRGDRLIYANQHFRYLFRCFKRIEPLLGLSFEHILRVTVESGEIAEDGIERDREGWIRRRVAEHQSRPYQAFDQRLTDGRCLQIKERATPDGGSVLLWVYITDAMRQRLRLEDAIAGACDGFALWSDADKLLASNDSFARLFGGKTGLERGVNFEEVLDGAVDAGRVRPMGDPEGWIGQLLSSRDERGIRTEFQTANGRWFQLAETHTRDGSIASVLTDVTQLKQTETELRRRGDALEKSVNELKDAQAKLSQQGDALAAANVELESARVDAERSNTYKTSFLRSITHELRTPLNAIMGFSEVLESQALGPLGNDKYREYVGYIRTSGHHLLSLINQLLDLSRIEAGKMELKREDHDAGEIAQYCARMLNENAARGEVTLRLALPETTPAVHADILAARQVTLNLLSNAIKFTPKGGAVTLGVEARDGFCVFTVADTGAGIAEEDLPRLMQPFMQAGDILTRRDKGSGLGLAIAKALTELQGGRIELESTVGVGTTARVFLPLAKADTAGEHQAARKLFPSATTLPPENLPPSATTLPPCGGGLGWGGFSD